MRKNNSRYNQTNIDIGSMYAQISINRSKFRERFSSQCGNDIDLLEKITFELSPKDFEYLACIFLEYKHVIADVASNNIDKMGVDIIARKDGEKYGYQCKQWSSSYISLGKIGEMYAKLHIAKKRYGFNEVGLITTSSLCPDSREFLEDINIPFYDGEAILGMAKALGLDDEEKWKNLNKKIQAKRAKDILKEHNQMRMGNRDVHYEILKRRIYEMAKHTTDYREDGLWINFHYKELKNKRGFQYWI